MNALRTLQDQLNRKYPQRRDAIEAIILGVITRQHVYLHGVPGTAKSSLARTALEALPGRTFTAALSTTRPPEAILGPYDIEELQRSKFLRRDDGYLTTANWVMLDEIGKINPAVGHDLLAALNERLKIEVNDGRSEHPIPLEMAVCTSNEPLASEDSAALWDRLLLRVHVKPVESLLAIWQADDTTVAPVSPQDVIAAREGASAVTVTDAVLITLDELRKDLPGRSDRRWMHTIPVLQAKAWLDGDRMITANHLAALMYTMWEPASDGQDVARVIAEAALNAPKHNPLTGSIQDRVKQAISQIENPVRHPLL